MAKDGLLVVNGLRLQLPKILAVDDSRDVLVLLSAVFKRAGHDVITETNPLRVLDVVAQYRPDAVILDVMMPQRSGWDVLRELRGSPEWFDLPIVMLTSRGDKEDRLQGLRGGADDYQVKPVDNEEILARVEGLIARFLPRAPAPPTIGMVISEIESRLGDERGLAGISLGRYQIRELLGRGAMGTVLRGWDPKLGRGVALKTLRLLEGDPKEHREQVSRLLREAVVEARVHHPNIVSVYDVGEDDTGAYIAMELVEGKTLETFLVDRGYIGHDRLLPIAGAIARGLAAAHGHQILHRDVKPGNVLLSDTGVIKVTDFGIAELASEASVSRVIHGTPGYLAPELLDGEVASVASDLFSLGVLLYECATGRHPFQALNWRRILQLTVSKNPPPLDQVMPETPAEFSALVQQLMEKNKENRPTSSSLVASYLDDMVATESRVETSV